MSFIFVILGHTNSFLKEAMNMIDLVAIIPFFKEAMNMIDLVAIIPFYLNILLEGLEDFEIIGNFYSVSQ